MKMTFGSRPFLHSGLAVETITAHSSRNRDWSGSVGTPDRVENYPGVEVFFHVGPDGAQVRTEKPAVKVRTVRGERRPFSLAVGSWQGNALAREIFRAAGVTEGDWTWTVTSTRQTFEAWRTA